MSSHHEVPIPKSRADVIFQSMVIAVVVIFTVVAVVNLCGGVGLVASVIWLALVTAVIWSASRQEGGLRKFLVSQMGDLFGRRFVEWDSVDARCNDIHFGFQLCGRRFVQKSIPRERIQSVEWTTGQATHMAGRDMNDWTVWVWFDRDDPIRAEAQRKWHRRPDQDLYGVGPADRKERTEALGLSFISFLRTAGLDLIQSATTTCFVRRTGGEEGTSQDAVVPGLDSSR
jgi:hypothetical protein